MGDRPALDPHEIRTRLTSISLALQLLARRTELSDRQRTLVRTASEQAAALRDYLDRVALAEAPNRSAARKCQREDVGLFGADPNADVAR